MARRHLDALSELLERQPAMLSPFADMGASEGRLFHPRKMLAWNIARHRPKVKMSLAVSFTFGDTPDMIEPHPLRKWRQAENVTLKSLSELAGVCSSHLSQVETGKRSVSLETARRLQEITKNAVLMDDFVQPRSADTPRARAHTRGVA